MLLVYTVKKEQTQSDMMIYHQHG